MFGNSTYIAWPLTEILLICIFPVFSQSGCETYLVSSHGVNSLGWWVRENIAAVYTLHIRGKTQSVRSIVGGWAI